MTTETKKTAEELRDARNARYQEYKEAFDAAIHRIDSDPEISERNGAACFKGYLNSQDDVDLLRLVATGTMEEIIEELG